MVSNVRVQPSVAVGRPRRSWRLISVLILLLSLMSTLLVSAQSTDDAAAQDGDAMTGEGGATGAVGILAFDDPDNFTLAGRLGVGIETPAYVVDARDSRNTTARLRLLNSSAGANAAADLYLQTAGAGQGVALTKFGAGYTGTWSGQPLANRAWLRSDTNATGLILTTGGNAPLIFGANNAERLRIAPNGNVGIGLNDPTYALHIRAAGTLLALQSPNKESAMQFHRDGSATAQASFGFLSAGNDNLTLLNNVPGGDIILWPDYPNAASGSRVGILTHTPEGQLDVRGTAFLDQGIVRGRLGVGLDNGAFPQVPLHVRGGGTGLILDGTTQDIGILWRDNGQNTADLGFLSPANDNFSLINEVAGGDIMLMPSYSNGGAGGVVSVGLLDGPTDRRADLYVNGTATARVLQITGGADLAEPFVMTAADAVEPGTVAILDAENSGQLRVSATAYDPLVAGIVSGAGGINPGLIMQQEDATIAGESYPIALTGKVYVKAVGPIKIGDLLTTSDLPGHAMAATDRDRAFGATLGKAMSSLAEGTGLVLVLVSLQ